MIFSDYGGSPSIQKQASYFQTTLDLIRDTLRHKSLHYALLDDPDAVFSQAPVNSIEELTGIIDGMFLSFQSRMQAAEVQTEQDIQTLSSLERSNKLVLEENNYLRKRLEAHAADVERAENRLAQ